MEQLERELADTFCYLSLLAQRAGVRLSVAVPRVFDAKSAERGYPIRIAEQYKHGLLKMPGCEFGICPNSKLCYEQNRCINQPTASEPQ